MDLHISNPHHSRVHSYSIFNNEYHLKRKYLLKISIIIIGLHLFFFFEVSYGHVICFGGEISSSEIWAEVWRAVLWFAMFPFVRGTAKAQGWGLLHQAPSPSPITNPRKTCNMREKLTFVVLYPWDVGGGGDLLLTWSQSICLVWILHCQNYKTNKETVIKLDSLIENNNNNKKHFSPQNK